MYLQKLISRKKIVLCWRLEELDVLAQGASPSA
jgi:hypothetical protein